jgi:hypothetical protein
MSFSLYWDYYKILGWQIQVQNLRYLQLIKPAMRDLETQSAIDPINSPVYVQASYLN